MEFCLQKISNENGKLKEEYQTELEIILKEKEATQKLNENTLFEMSKELDKWKKV